MSRLTVELPRLTGLIAFEAAARHLSFTTAAHELRVTQSAVSQQVRTLESALGAMLFARSNRGLELTENGRLLYRAVTLGFDCMSAGIEEIRAARKPTVTVGTTNAIASYWLVPRLQSFRTQYPEIDINIVAADLGFNAVAEGIDAGIVFGRGTWPGFQSQLLCEGDVFPVCSPSYLRTRPPLGDARQLLNETLLMLDNERATVISWPLWFAIHGIRSGYHRRIKFNTLSLLLQATYEGQGIALGWSLLTDSMLERGVLVRPLPTILRTEGRYYFVMAEKSSRPEVLSFQRWVLSQFPQVKRDVGHVAGSLLPQA